MPKDRSQKKQTALYTKCKTKLTSLLLCGFALDRILVVASFRTFQTVQSVLFNVTELLRNAVKGFHVVWLVHLTSLLFKNVQATRNLGHNLLLDERSFALGVNVLVNARF